MKKFTFLLFLLPIIAFGQTTAILDVKFEQALINLGYDSGTPDGFVSTANINSITSLNVNGNNISDLTGIENFAGLTTLHCSNNQLTSLDVRYNILLTSLGCHSNQISSLDLSMNTNLYYLTCYDNLLTSLDLSSNPDLTSLNCESNHLASLNVSNTSIRWLYCGGNQLTSLDLSTNTVLADLHCPSNKLTSLDISQNTGLGRIWCYDNQLTSLDVSNNPSLILLGCHYNLLTSLDLRNGNNQNMGSFHVNNNPSLHCINVDDSSWANQNWTVLGGHLDSQQYFSNNCIGTTDIPERPAKPIDLLYITDVLGRTTLPVPNRVLFYIYEDGSVEKKIRLER